MRSLALFSQILARPDYTFDLVREAWAQSRRHGREILQIYLKNDSLFMPPQRPLVQIFDDPRIQVVLSLGPMLGVRRLPNGKMNYIP